MSAPERSEGAGEVHEDLRERVARAIGEAYIDGLAWYRPRHIKPDMKSWEDWPANTKGWIYERADFVINGPEEPDHAHP